MIRAYKYRIYPNKAMTAKIDKWLATCCELWNSCRLDIKRRYNIDKETFKSGAQVKIVQEWAKQHEFLGELYSQVRNDVVERLDKAFEAYFRRLKEGKEKEEAGFPKFKRRDDYNSFTYTQKGFKVQGNTLTMSFLGTVRMKLHRPLPDTLKRLTIKRKNGKYYAVFACKVEPAPLPKTGAVVGIDVGIKSFVATSDGDLIESQQHYRDAERRLAILQRAQSKKKRGSIQYRKLAAQIAKLSERVANKRRDMMFKASHVLMSDYDVVYHEKLNIKGMVRNKHLSKSISDAGWGMFIDALKNKAATSDKAVVGVNPAYTSQRCSKCYTIVPENAKLDKRVFICPACGNKMDRDINAAKNILDRGTSLMWLTQELSDPDNVKNTGDRQK